jgi:poly(3-hydroxybutyrate) depolymerase
MSMKYPQFLLLVLSCSGVTAACSDTTPDNDGGAGMHAGATAGAAGSAATGGNSGTGGVNVGAGTTNGGSTATGGGSSGTAGMPNGGAGGSGGGSSGSAGAAGSGGAGAGSGGMSGGGNGGSAGAGGNGAATSSAGCGKTPTLTSGKRSISSGGQNRSFILRLPETYDKSKPHRLIFAYHWVGGTAEDVDGGGTSGFTWSYYGMREQAENTTIFVAPQGVSNGWGNGNNSDVIFTDDMLKQIEGDLCVDTRRVFAMGFSYGGGMSKALGCQRPNVFRAVAVYAGADFLSGGCDDSSTMPIAYIGLHSINDGTNPYSSGETIRDRFVKNNGCTPQTPPKPQGLTHVCTTYQGCKPGYPAEWCAFDGGGHTPAPLDGSTSGSGGGDKTWTKAEVWKFFTQF